MAKFPQKQLQNSYKLGEKMQKFQKVGKGPKVKKVNNYAKAA